MNTAGIAFMAFLVVAPFAAIALEAHLGRADAMRRHPSNFDAHWADVVDIFDDGKALVREVEDHLRSVS